MPIPPQPRFNFTVIDYHKRAGNAILFFKRKRISVFLIDIFSKKPKSAKSVKKAKKRVDREVGEVVI